MDRNIACGLVILTVLVLIVIFYEKDKKSNKTCNSQPIILVNSQDMDNDRHQRAPWGTGTQNIQLAKQYNMLDNADNLDNYDQVMKYQALEPEVFDSHENYSIDVGITNSGASAMTVRTDDNFPVPFVGIRRPYMHDVYAGAEARQVHTEYPSQMPAKTHYLL